MAPATSPPVEAPDKESLINRNPHANFAAVEASRPPYPQSSTWTLTKTPSPTWQPGSGATASHWRSHKHISIDPWAENRTTVMNYKLFTSTTVPRPIALVSTVGTDGVRNLAPFSYWQNVCTDPPLYSLSLVGSAANDTLANILSPRQACISTVPAHIIEAANLTSINTPPQTSEWPLSGLTPSPSSVITPPFVAESPFSAECTLHSHQELHSKVDGSRTATLVLLEVVRWHVWEDALGEDGGTVDLGKLGSVWRAGGIQYGTCFVGFELPRPEAWRKVRGRMSGLVEGGKIGERTRD